jgi:hypothetical protein
MNHRLIRCLTSWPFLLSLALLLANDLVFKLLYPGWVSGKLSDFAGIAVVAMLLFTWRPRRIWLVSMALALLFAWWKSEASEPLIYFVRMLGVAGFGRAVDYTDLIALTVLPLCARVANDLERFVLPWQKLRRLIAVPVIGATLFAVMGTSVTPTLQNESKLFATPSSPRLQREAVASMLKDMARRYGLVCESCADPLQTASYHDGRRLKLSYVFASDTMMRLTVQSPGGGFWGRSSGDKTADALRAELRTEFDKRFPEIRYVEMLR